MPNGKKTTKSEEIALFRFSIIAPVIHNTQENQARYFKDMAKTVYTLPDGSSKQFHWRTFKSWLRLYRANGFDGLKPDPRADSGVSRVISRDLESIIRTRLEEFPSLSVAALYRILVNDGSIMDGSPAEGTLRSFITRTQLRPRDTHPVPRKKFEKPFINDLWLTDFLHGPRLSIDGKKTKLFLTAIIDDHSRCIVGFRWALQENVKTLELALKDAFSTYGLPKMLYCDNGSVYVSAHLQLVCARLGIALVHSKPYDSPSRGKIERFFRTVRELFLALFPLNQQHSLEDVNRRFREWLDHDYHRRFHHGINETPFDRYLNNAAQVAIRRVDANELDRHFYQTLNRTVKNDATVSVGGVLFEVPPRYIGSTIELRHPTGQEADLWLYEHDAPILRLHPVDVVANSSSHHLGIQFNSLHTED